VGADHPGTALLFHALTYAAITIAFWPHLVMLLAFLPLEEYRDRWRARRAKNQSPDEKTKDEQTTDVKAQDARTVRT